MLVSQVQLGLASKLGLTVHDLNKLGVRILIPPGTSTDDALVVALRRTILTALQEVFPEFTKVCAERSSADAVPSSSDSTLIPDAVIAKVHSLMRASDKEDGFSGLMDDALRKSAIRYERH